MPLVISFAALATWCTDETSYSAPLQLAVASIKMHWVHLTWSILLHDDLRRNKWDEHMCCLRFVSNTEMSMTSRSFPDWQLGMVCCMLFVSLLPVDTLCLMCNVKQFTPAVRSVGTTRLRLLSIFSTSASCMLNITARLFVPSLRKWFYLSPAPLPDKTAVSLPINVNTRSKSTKFIDVCIVSSIHGWWQSAKRTQCRCYCTSWWETKRHINWATWTNWSVVRVMDA